MILFLFYPVKLRGEYDDLHTDISVKQIYDDDENENNNDKTKMKIKKTTKKAVIKKIRKLIYYINKPIK